MRTHTGAPPPSREARPEHPSPSLLTLAWPVFVRRSATSGAGVLDALLVVGLGDQALLGVTIATLNVECAIALPLGVVGLTQTFASQLSGRQDPPAAIRFAWYGVLVAALAGALAVIATPAAQALIGTLQYDAPTRSILVTFVGIRLLGAGPLIAGEALASWFAGTGDTRIGMWASLASFATHLVLALILVHGAPGVPAWGVAGAAWAHVIGSVAGLAVLSGPFLLRHGLPIGLAGSEAMQLLRTGLPTGVDGMLELTAYAFFANVTLASVPVHASTAMMVVLQLDELGLAPGVGIAVAAGVLTGRAIGARRPDRVPDTLRRAVVSGVSVQVVVAVPYVAAGVWLVGDASPSGGLPSTLGALLVFGLVWRVLDTVAMSTSEVLKATGDTFAAMVARLVAAWLVLVPVTHVMVATWGLRGAVAGVTLYAALLSALLLLRFRGGTWRRIGLVDGTG